MSANAKDMVLASFLGDTLALGVHWIYDQAKIKRLHPNLAGPTAPDPKGYHPTQRLGGFTHYGDQTVLLLLHLGDTHGFDPAAFLARWRAFFSDYPGYVDKASRNTLDRLAQGWEFPDAGSASDDLAGASRIAPVVYALRADPEAAVKAARAQTAATHNNAKVVDAAEFFTRTALLALSGVAPVTAMQQALDGRLPGSALHGWLAQGLDAAGQDSLTAITAFGQSCHIDGAFQSVVQLIASHPADLDLALLDSARAGGDSAARNMLVGLVLGAANGLDSQAQGWLAQMAATPAVLALLGRLDATA